jgi:hypothetical protein
MGFVKVVPDVATEFGKQERSAFLATAFVPNWVLDLDLVEHRAIVQLDVQRIPDRAFFRVVVLDAEALVLDTMDLGTKCVDAWVGGRLVIAAGSGQQKAFVSGKDKNGLALRVEVSVNKRVRDHVTNGVAMHDKRGVSEFRRFQ